MIIALQKYLIFKYPSFTKEYLNRVVSFDVGQGQQTMVHKPNPPTICFSAAQMRMGFTLEVQGSTFFNVFFFNQKEYFMTNENGLEFKFVFINKV